MPMYSLNTARLGALSLLLAGGCGAGERTPAAAPQQQSNQAPNPQPASTPTESAALDSTATPTAAPETTRGTSPAPDAQNNSAGSQTKPPGLRVQETRTQAVIRQVVLSHRGKVRECYERELAKSPGLRGKLTVHFKILPNGTVDFAEVNGPRSSLHQPMLGLCAINVIKSIQFPPSSRGFESLVNYPFDFNP